MTTRVEIRNRTDKTGKAALRIVVQDGSSRTFIPLPIKILPAEWDKAKQQVNKKHPHSELLNRTIRIKVAEMEIELLKGQAPTKSEYPTFRQYAIECMNRWEKTKSASTIRAYQSMLRKFNEFAGNKRIDEITPLFLQQYDTYCRQQGLQDAGVLKRVSFVATILHEAQRYGIIQFDPFQVYQKPKKINPKKTWLTMDEIKTIGEMDTDSDTLQNVAVWFVFACYTGFRYSDVAAFNPDKSIADGRISLYTTKTKEVVSIKIHGSLQAILNKWPQVPVFSNQKCNQYLKAIAHVCRIDKVLTFHTARHSFAVNCANLGISQEVTSKLLGHSDLRTTNIYYKIVNERIDKEMDKWG